MGIPEFVQEILRRSGKKMEEFASAAGVSLNTLSNVKNENKPGTWRIVMGAIDAGDLKIEDCLTLPPDPSSNDEDEKVLHTLRQALRRGGFDKETVYDCAETLKRRTGRKKRKAG
jgi:transcriptional regulator with XRE-family HTH domain